MFGNKKRIEELLFHRKAVQIGYGNIKSYLDEFLLRFDKNRTGIKGVVLYGSMAKNKGRLTSDIDLLFITTDIDKTRQEIYKCESIIVQKACSKFFKSPYYDLPLSPIVLTDSEFENYAERDRINKGGFLCNVADDGIVLYDVNNQTSRYLNKLRLEPHERDMLIP